MNERNDICLFEEDRELVKERPSEVGYIPGRLDFGGSELDLGGAGPLTPAERLEFENTDHKPINDKDGKNIDK